jgi:hypothetical protein
LRARFAQLQAVAAGFATDRNGGPNGFALFDAAFIRSLRCNAAGSIFAWQHHALSAPIRAAKKLDAGDCRDLRQTVVEA